MRIKAEWEGLKDVMIHRPGIEIEYAMLAPKPFLFERPFRTDIAVQEHESLERTLKENGVNVRLLRDIVVSRARSDSSFRSELQEKVSTIVKFYGKIESSERAVKQFRKNLDIIDPITLFHILTLEPSIDLKKEEENSVDYPTVYSNLPLANLYFMRDQQAVGPGGVVFGRMKKRQRMKEPEITRFVVEGALKEKDTFSVKDDGAFEGGDFIPCGKFGLIGIGPRSNRDGALQAMSSGKFDFDEIGIVSNPVYDFMDNPSRDPMINMHLDTYFNIAADGVVISSVELSKKARVEVHGKDSKGEYSKQSEISLYDYMVSKGFSFINLRISEQLSYSSNFLTLSDRKIMAVNAPDVLDKLLREKVFPEEVEKMIISDVSKNGREHLFPNNPELSKEGIDVIGLKLSELTGGYGGAHCMTAALNRQ